MADNSSWNGNSRPFNGAEDGVPFEEGESGNPDGREAEHGIYVEDEKFFDEHPEIREMRDDLIESLLEDCKYPDRQEHIITRYATLFTKLEFAHANIGAIDSNDTWDKLGALETKTQRWYDRIDWEDAPATDTSAGGFFDAISSDDDGRTAEETADDLFDV